MDYVWLAPIATIAALGFSGYLFFFLRKQSPGDEEMQRISAAIKEGASAYLRRQYNGVAVFFVAFFFVLLAMAWGDFLSYYVSVAFITGGFFSGLCGFIGMKVATMSNARTAAGAKDSLNKGLRIAFSSGTVMGMMVVGLGLFYISIWFYYLKDIVGMTFEEMTPILITLGMGASAMALFARVGGGIYTKAADVGADLVGKVEAGIPEDDARNPASIADNVGDNVGDVAGMGADLYESYVGSIIATMALGLTAAINIPGVNDSVRMAFVFAPLAMASVGVLASILGTFLVQTKEEADQHALLTALRRGIYSSTILTAIAGYFILNHILGDGYLGIWIAVIAGLVAGNVIGISTEYFTSDTYTPTKKIAASSKTGPATVILRGMSVGMISTVIPVLAIGVAILTAFFMAGGSLESPEIGLYGIGMAAVGMLSTLGITLATDAYGPVADNAGGIAEMSHQPSFVRDRTDALDSLGNTTAATGKGFAIGSAALTAMALVAAFLDVIRQRTGEALAYGDIVTEYSLNLLNPYLIVGLFIGAMLPFLFCSLTINAVGKAAEKIVKEVRSQFRRRPGIMKGTERPDYARVVDIVTRSAQKEMVIPSLIAIGAPIGMGVLFGVAAVVGLLMGALVTGFMLALFMANTGGAWDNAKKYIEKGHYGGKGSDSHKASVVGDTVGDPFKDTSGPSLNILIKLMAMTSIVFASIFI